MPDINALFLRFMDEKGAFYVAKCLDHADTAIVKRWEKEKNVPDSKRWRLYGVLKDEGYLS